MKKYPSIDETLRRKREQRRLLAKLPFEKKIELALKMNERRKFIKSGVIVDSRRDGDTN